MIAVIESTHLDLSTRTMPQPLSRLQTQKDSFFVKKLNFLPKKLSASEQPTDLDLSFTSLFHISVLNRIS